MYEKFYPLIDYNIYNLSSLISFEIENSKITIECKNNIQLFLIGIHTSFFINEYKNIINYCNILNSSEISDTKVKNFILNEISKKNIQFNKISIMGFLFNNILELSIFIKKNNDFHHFFFSIPVIYVKKEGEKYEQNLDF